MVEHVNDYTVQKNILIGQESYYLAVPVKVSGTASATIYAGQPLTGDLTDRGTAFTASTTGAVGVLLHDLTLDSDGNGNGTLVIKGCLDAEKLEDDIVTAIGTAAIDGIVLVEGSAI